MRIEGIQGEKVWMGEEGERRYSGHRGEEKVKLKKIYMGHRFRKIHLEKIKKLGLICKTLKSKIYSFTLSKMVSLKTCDTNL